MRKSIAQISSQISSDSPEEPYTGAITNTNFVTSIETETRKAWHQKAQGVIKQAKAEASDIMERYDDAVKIRHPKEINAILTTLHSDLAPHNATLDKLMAEYMLLEKQRYELLEVWEKAVDETGQRAGNVGEGMEVKVQDVIAEEQKAVVDFDGALGRIKRPRKTDDTIVPSDEE